MKKIYKIITLIAICGFLAAGMTSCLEETFPHDGSATGDEAENTPEYWIAGMDAWMISQSYGTWNSEHYDFNYPSIMIMMEMEGQDVVSRPSNYDQFSTWYQVTAGLGPDYVSMSVPWLFFYRLIKLANLPIASLDPATATSDQLAALAQSYAYRAFAYFNMVQIYQYTYVGHQGDPAVPIVTETTTEQQAANNPRATVEQVYALILDDLKKAEQYMSISGYKSSNPIKINLNVIQGMFARIYLVMQNFDEAQRYANLAKVGYTPLTELQYMDASTEFNSISSQKSWMWGLDVTKNDDCVKTGIINFTSQMCNTFVSGYAVANGGGPQKWINARLYDAIPTADWRKATWASAQEVIPYPNGQIIMAKYASYKFKPEGGDMMASEQACDIPLMRVEEIMLIEAEAAARGTAGLAAGKQLLDEFLALRTKSGQTPMKSTATSVDDFINEVWTQRRIELWGEGHSFFDIKRLEKGITRSYTDTNHQVGSRYNTTTTPYWMNFCISRSETQSNKGIPQSANNPTPERPADVEP